MKILSMEKFSVIFSCICIIFHIFLRKAVTNEEMTHARGTHFHLLELHGDFLRVSSEYITITIINSGTINSSLGQLLNSEVLSIICHS